MGILKNIKSIFPIPKAWETDGDRKAFALRVDQYLRELYMKVSRCVTYTKPPAEQQPSADEQAQARANIGASAVEDCVYYGTCSTGAATQTKEVTIAGFPSALAAGQKVLVNFTNSQQYNGTPKLKINSLDSKSIHRTSGTSAIRYEWYSGSTVLFTYDGSAWVMEDGGHATTDYWGRTKLVDALTSTSVAMALTANQGKVLDESMIHNTGTEGTYEEATGSKWFKTRYFAVGKSSVSRYHNVYFRHDDDSNCAVVQVDSGNATNQTLNRMQFVEWSPKSTPDEGNTGYYEVFRLPAPTPGRTANGDYSILTSKDPEGGRSALELGDAAQLNDCILYQAAATSHTFNVPSNSRNVIISCGDGVTRLYIAFVYGANNGAVTITEIAKGSAVTSVTTDTNKITITKNVSNSIYLRCVNLRGGVLSNP